VKEKKFKGSILALWELEQFEKYLGGPFGAAFYNALKRAPSRSRLPRTLTSTQAPGLSVLQLQPHHHSQPPKVGCSFLSPFVLVSPCPPI
jgi:hypothetical protein